MVDIPEDLRQLQDFPTYDITFQDSPKFRQNLNHWTFKTDKVGGEHSYDSRLAVFCINRTSVAQR